MTTATEPPGSSFRSIRVFVSSTFRDMQEEREELVKRTFPQLRRLCEARGVVWSEVDLRWGVTDEQKAEGAVLPICLAEIDRSRPYFIGLLGQRYGWIPEELPEGLADLLPWLRTLDGTSVTEMEILHGVLNDPTAAEHSFFYTRDPAWVAARSAEEQAVLGESASDDEIATVGAEVAAVNAAARRERLEQLKHRVVAAGLPTWQYPDPRALGERVLADFTALIERLFPAGEAPDIVLRDAEAHRAYGAAQALGAVPRTALLARLDEFARSAEQPLILRGEAGSGTSSIVSTWVQTWRAGHPEDVVVEHHIGATADASDWAAMATRFVRELARGHSFERDVDVDAVANAPTAAARRGGLFAALDRAAASPRRTVIVVDGAELLDDVDGAADLTWLPARVAPAVRVVVATAGDRPAVEAARRGWPVVDVPALDEGERRAFIRTFLGRYAKGLDEVHVARLVAPPATGNSLYLRTVLDELRQHGDHFTLGQVLDHYLAAPTLDDLLGLVLARYEADFERDRPGLVRDAMAALWAARRGLSEPELLDVLAGAGADAATDTATDAAPGGDRLPGAVWSPLLLAAEAGLVTKGGQLTFSTEPHRRAVERRYLRDASEQRAAHTALARVFARSPLGPRVVDELPWQQLAAGDTAGLAATLAGLEFTDMAYRQSHSDLRRLWRRAEEAGFRVVDGYRSVVDDPASNPEMAWEVARLVTDAGYPLESMRLNRFLVERYRGITLGQVTPSAGIDIEVAARRLPAALVNCGAALMAQGELAAAEAPLLEAITLSRSRQDLVVLHHALGNLALSRRDRGDLDGALVLFTEEEAICRRLGDGYGLQASLGNRAQLLRQRGDFAGALAVMTEQESLCRTAGDALGVARALAGQGAVLGDLGNPQEALGRFVAYRVMCEELGDLHGLVEAGISEANTLRQLGRRDEAAARATEIEALARRTAEQPLLARILDAQARTAVEEGRWADALRLSTEAVLTARSAGATTALVLALGMLGTAQRELGDLVSARASHVEEEAVARGLGDIAAIAGAQVNLAAVDIVGGDMQSVLGRYGLAEPVLRQLGVHMTLVPLYNNRWQVHASMGNFAAAADDLIAGGRACAAMGALAQSQQMLTQAVEYLYSLGRMAEAEPIWANLAQVAEGLGDEAALQRALGEHALMATGRGDTVTATELFDRQEEICRRIGDLVGLAACVGNRAILLRNAGDLSGALGCIDEQLDIARSSGNGQGYLFATANRGEVLGALGRVAEGLAALDEARTMAVNWNLGPMVQQLDQMIAALRAGQQ